MLIFSGNLPFSLSDNDLKTLFLPYGNILSSTIILNKTTNKSTGIGFINMPNKLEAENAINSLNNKNVNGRNIIVNEAIEINSKI